MQVAVIGASGRTGGEVVRQAVSRGYGVVAIARRPQRLSFDDSLAPARDTGQLCVRAADVLDAERLAEALAHADGVVYAVGMGASRRPTRVYSAGTVNVLMAMSVTGAARLAVISAAPVGPREAQPVLQRRVVMPILDRVFGATYEDMGRMEAVLGDSDVDWVSLRAPRLLARPAVGHYRIDRRPLPSGGSLTIPDLSTALLDCLCRPELQQQALYVAN